MRRAPAQPESVDPGLLREADLKPKSMIGVGSGGRPFLDYLLLNAAAAGYRDVVLVVGESDVAIRSYYTPATVEGLSGALRVSFAEQPIPTGRTKPLGTADALQRGLRSRPEWVGSRFTVCNSDNLYSREALHELLTCTHQAALIDYDRDALKCERERIEQFAVLRTDEDGFLVSLIEKPSPEEIAALAGPGGRVGVSMNIFRLGYDLILPYLDRVPLHPRRQEVELPVAVGMLAADRPRTVFTIPRAEHVPDLTSRDDIARVQAYLRLEFGAHGEMPS
jgi:glucose-1-phosphate thymidylyltransferase/glucose-1-phosphate adenylyltransferase